MKIPIHVCHYLEGELKCYECGKSRITFTQEPNKKEMCSCGEQETFGGAEVEIGGVCHRPDLPCYIIDDPETETTSEECKIQVAIEVVKRERENAIQQERERIIKLLESYEIKKQPLCEQNILIMRIKTHILNNK
jgi:hypothetical protein